MPEDQRGRRIVVDLQGNEIPDGSDPMDEGVYFIYHELLERG